MNIKKIPNNLTENEYLKLPVDIRIKLADEGRFIEYAIKDQNSNVRFALVSSGYAWDELADDPEWTIRSWIAKEGYRPEYYCKDKDDSVRRAVAYSGNCLDILINDESKYVRLAVVDNLYGLEKLIYDEDESVRERARDKMKVCNALGINRKQHTVEEKDFAMTVSFDDLVRNAEEVKKRKEKYMEYSRKKNNSIER